MLNHRFAALVTVGFPICYQPIYYNPVVFFAFEILFLFCRSTTFNHLLYCDGARMFLLYLVPTIFSSLLLAAKGRAVFGRCDGVKHFWFCMRLLVCDTVAPRLRDTRDAIRVRTASGAWGI